MDRALVPGDLINVAPVSTLAWLERPNDSKVISLLAGEMSGSLPGISSGMPRRSVLLRKQIVLGEESRQSIHHGVNTLNGAVKVTLGPRGMRTVGAGFLISHRPNRAPFFSDGIVFLQPRFLELTVAHFIASSTNINCNRRGRVSRRAPSNSPYNGRRNTLSSLSSAAITFYK
jgi:hypothetical protein